MAFGFGSLTAWAPVALLSLVGLRAPAQVEALRSLPQKTAVAVGARSNVVQAVLRKLNDDPHLQASGLIVAERNGVVELRGTVPVSSWRTRAARISSVVHGVRGVVNDITVVPVRRTDEAVAANVRRSLRATAALAKMPITVRVTDGVVELSGVISTWEQQQLAERVAVGVTGVRFCQNQLTSSRSMKRTPAMIAADIRSRLDWDPFVRNAPVEVTVNVGRVALNGRVGGPAERRRIIAHAWVKGVVAVDAKSVVVDVSKRPDSDVRLRFPTDAEISIALQDLTPFWPSVATSNLGMSVVAGVVTLRGTVQTLAEKRAAEDLARSAVGVTAVTSDLRGPWWRPPVTVTPPPSKPSKRPRRAR